MTNAISGIALATSSSSIPVKRQRTSSGYGVSRGANGISTITFKFKLAPASDLTHLAQALIRRSISAHSTITIEIALGHKLAAQTRILRSASTATRQS